MKSDLSDNIKCPYCNNLVAEQIDNNSNISKGIVKNGVIKYKGKERQRYLCNDCKSNFYPIFTESKIDKCRQAIIMYLEGVNIKEIGDLLKVDRGTVQVWINKCGNSISLESIRNRRRVNTTKIEGVFTISIKKDTKDPFAQKHLDSFSIIEKSDRTYLSFLKGNQLYGQYFDIKVCKVETNEEGY